jgi:hypothetical protein
MTDWVPWFRYQLQASADGFVWAFAQIDASLYERLPPAPGYLGTWPPARHVWHVTEYERCLVVPSMRQWLGGDLASEDAWPDDDATWAAVRCREFDALADAFQAVRQEQIQLLDQLADVDWTAPRETLWGWKPLAMIVTKTFQHTYEHGDTLLRMGLWWEQFAREESAAQTGAGG